MEIDMGGKKIITIIPAYEPSSGLCGYAKLLLESDIDRIVVVNDGSGDEYAGVFDILGAMPRCTVITHTDNAGKGSALKTAFRYCREKFDDGYVFVTADCDGQYKTDDIKKTAAFAEEYDGSMVLGVRDFSSENVLTRSRAGNRNTRRILRLLCGINLSDVQTGLRAFTYGLIDNLIDVPGGRFEYEMSQLISLSNKGIIIREVPIESEAAEKDGGNGSHFKIFSDSARIIGVMLKNLGLFAVSGGVSGIADATTFFILCRFAFAHLNDWLMTLLSTVGARVISSVINFSINRKLVFKGKTRKSIIRYYILWSCQLGVSYFFACLWNKAFSAAIAVTAMKAASDLMLSMLSYRIQSAWVFSDRVDTMHFFSPYVTLCRGVFRIFTRHYQSLVKEVPGGAVYVCRHLNMHGPATVLRSFRFDTHPFVLHVFFDFGEAFRHYKNITYAQSKRLGKNLKAFFATFSAVPIITGMKSVPVYRDDSRSINTIRMANKYLQSGESVLVFPDIDYKAGAGSESDIYDGFLLLERMYYRTQKKHLRFIPVRIDEERGRVTEGLPIKFEDGDFYSQINGVAEQVKVGINPARKA